MRSPFRILTLLFISLYPWLGSLPSRAQSQVGIPFEKQQGFILGFAPPYARMSLDLEDSTLSSDGTVEVELAPGAAFTTRKGTPVDRSELRPGLEVSLAGEKLGKRLVIQSVKVLTEIEDRKVKISGVFEKLRGRVATVGGQLVTLREGVAVSGNREWKGKSFASFDDMMLGSFVEIQGVRGTDGPTVATRAETWPNLYTEVEDEMLGQLRQGLVLPAGNQLAGGSVQIGGQEFRLVRDLKVQTYVTRVGLKLVPAHLRSLPADDPGRITFRFYVIEDPTFNAFAYPDGSVFVHTGLLALIENEAQLAAVLGHEIAHVTHEHGRQQYQAGQRIETGKKAAKIAGRAAEMLGKVNPFKKEVVIAGREVGLEDAIEFGTGLFSNIYSRDMENQADRVGLFYMYDAGYDPREAPRVWGAIVDQIGRQNRVEVAVSKARTFLYSSHPEARARLSNLNREIALNWYDANFSQATVGKQGYKDAILRLRSK
ncbi:MAG TPA: M48 family metalloprotease [Thermoanaerobaculia bacterium]|nr:M48 family metalloprotease [Thermoanaerobaculia bacterium]